MTITGDLELYQLDTADATVVDLNSGNSTRITGNTYSFDDTGDILVDAGNYRVTFPDSGTIDSTFTVYLNQPAINTTTKGKEEFTSDGTISPVVSPDGGQEVINEVQILENTARKITLKVTYNSRNYYVLEFTSGAPVVKVTTVRGTRDSTTDEHHVGFNDDRRWSILGDGEVVRDDSLQSSSQSSSNTPENWVAHIDTDNHWVAGWATEYKWDNVEDGNDALIKVTDAGINEARQQWLLLAPTAQSEGATTGQFFHLSESDSNDDITHSVLFGAAGYWRLLYAPTNSDGVDDVQIDVNGSTVLSSGGTLAQNQYVATRPVKISSVGSHNVRVVVTDNDATDSADYELVWLPVLPDDNTSEVDIFAFPGYLSKHPLGRKVVKEDTLESR